MSNIFRIFNIFFNIKYNFKVPTKKDILLVDKLSEELINKTLFKKRYDILYAKKDRINLFILIKTLLTFKFFGFNEQYIHEYIRSVNPKVVISFRDNDISFYKLKSLFKKIKFISVQNGYRHKDEIFFNKLSKEKINKTKLLVDYYFLFGKNNVSKFKRFIKFESKLLGSFRNNKNPINKKKILKNSILFISNFRLQKVKYNKTGYNVEKKLLFYLEDFCIRHKINLNIVGSSITNKVLEKNYLLSNLREKNNINYYEKKTGSNIYSLIDRHDTIVFIDSTLGYEAMARQKKIACFSSRKNMNKIVRPFGFPNDKKFNNFFYSNYDTKDEVFRVLKNVFFTSNKNWSRYYFPELKNLISFNKNNILLYKTIKKILKN